MVVAVIKPRSPQEPLYKTIESTIQLIGELDISRGDKVIIKPNLCRVMPTYTGATTDVRMVEAIIKIIMNKARNCHIFVVESDNTQRIADTAFQRLGYMRLKKYGVTLSNISSEGSSLVDLAGGRFFHKLRVPKTLQHFDYFISIGKLKTHLFERISCILKNQFGCIPYREKSMFHPFLSEVLYDLNQFYKPDLCIVDGLIAMEGLGPTNGAPRQANTIIVGNDAVETDVAAAKIMGFNPRSVPHLNYAIKSFPEKERPALAPSSQLERLNFCFIPEYRYLWYRKNLRLARIEMRSKRIRRSIFYRGLRRAWAITGRFIGA